MAPSITSRDDLRPVASLVEELSGRRPAPSTVWRWCARGTRRAGKLPAIKVLGTWMTSHGALLAWLSAGSSPGTVPTAPPQRSESVQRRLERAGLLQGADGKISRLNDTTQKNKQR